MQLQVVQDDRAVTNKIVSMNFDFDDNRQAATVMGTVTHCAGDEPPGRYQSSPAAVSRRAKMVVRRRGRG